MIQWDIFAAVVALAVIPLTLSPGATWLLKSIVEPIYYVLLAWLWPTGTRCERLQWEDIPEGPLCVHTPATEWSDLCGSIKHGQEDCLQSTIGTTFSRAWISAQRREKFVKKPKGLDIRRSYVRMDVQTFKAYLMLAEQDPLFTFPIDQELPSIEFLLTQGVLTAHLSTGNTYGHPFCLMTKDDLKCLLQGYPPFYRKSFQMTDGTTLASPTTDPGAILTSPLKDSSDIPRAGWIVAYGLSSYSPVYLHTMTSSSQPFGNCFWKDTIVRSSFSRFQRALENLKSAFPNNKFALRGPEIYQMMVIEEEDMGSMYKVLWSMLGCEAGISSARHESKLTVKQWTVAMNCFNHWDPLTTDEINVLKEDTLQYVLIAAFWGLVKVMKYGRGRKSTFSSILSRTKGP